MFSGQHLHATACAGGSTAAGGALYIRNCDVTVDDCDLIDNSVSASLQKIPSPHGGGAINFEGGMLTIQNTVFRENVAADGNRAQGGAIWINSAQCTITGSTFDQNVSDPSEYPGRGGAIWMSEDSTLDISACSFTRNDAFQNGPSGGAIYGGSPTITNSFFCSNDPDHIDAAWMDGGGNVFLKSCIDGDLDFDGDVDFDDFTQLLANWGAPGCNGATPCNADIDGDGDVDFDDFTTLLANWSA